MHEIKALGTHWWIERLDGDKFSSRTCRVIDEEIRQFERDYSRFDDGSLVSKLSKNGRIDNPPVEILDMLDFACEVNELTEGVFNPLDGTTLGSIGYGGIPSKQNETGNFSENIKWDKTKVTLNEGQKLDIGGLGKGWLIDKLALILNDHGVREFIINGGGDLYVQSKTPVRFALEDPHDNTKSIGSLSLRKGALAASSVLKRRWFLNEKNHHHIVDPRISRPADSKVVASFVIAKSALVADVMATVLIIEPNLEAKLSEKFNIQAKLLTD